MLMICLRSGLSSRFWRCSSCGLVRLELGWYSGNFGWCAGRNPTLFILVIVNGLSIFAVSVVSVWLFILLNPR